MAKSKEIKILSCSELRVKWNEMKRRYMDFRFQVIIGDVDNHLQKRNIRREIAVLNTFIHQKELFSQTQ